MIVGGRVAPQLFTEAAPPKRSATSDQGTLGDWHLLA